MKGAARRSEPGVAIGARAAWSMTARSGGGQTRSLGPDLRHPLPTSADPAAHGTLLQVSACRLSAEVEGL